MTLANPPLEPTPVRELYVSRHYSEPEKWAQSLLRFRRQDVARIYLAAELAEAKQVEVILRANGRDYAVELEPYVRLSAGMESKPRLTPGETDGP